MWCCALQRSRRWRSAILIGVIGGSGLYELFDDGEDLKLPTPYGEHVTITVGQIGGRDVAFLPRHGRKHSVPPDRIDARASIWALASLGVRAVISTTTLLPQLAASMFFVTTSRVCCSCSVGLNSMTSVPA